MQSKGYMMDKYKVNRIDGRDNTNEKYIVIRVDTDAKHVNLNRKYIKEFAKGIKYKDRVASKMILTLLKSLEEEETTCDHCKGTCEFKVDAVCYTFNRDCDICKGTGIVKKTSTDEA